MPVTWCGSRLGAISQLLVTLRGILWPIFHRGSCVAADSEFPPSDRRGGSRLRRCLQMSLEPATRLRAVLFRHRRACARFRANDQDRVKKVLAWSPAGAGGFDLVGAFDAGFELAGDLALADECAGGRRGRGADRRLGRLRGGQPGHGGDGDWGECRGMKRLRSDRVAALACVPPG
jgi:hypothetical protein